MFKLNNKGQSLVLFVLIIPIILFILILVYDVASAVYEKNRISNTSYLAIEYYFDNIDSVNENDIINYILKNSKDLNNIAVVINNKTIDIEIDKDVKAIISSDINLIKIRSKYTGKLINDKRVIERIK